MSFGPFADFYIENGLGREISKEEARQVLQKAEEDGLVHCSSNHAGNKTFICNCCSCCCKVLTGVTQYDNPRAIVTSNYYATNDEETCTVCGTCVDRCPVSAIQIDDDHTVIARDRCIGCGLCASTCPTGSIAMARKSAQEVSFVFSSGKEMLQAMAKEAHKVYPFD